MYRTRKIILASASPRRKELLENTGLKFEIDPGDHQEDLSLQMSARRLARYLSSEKAKSVSGRHRDAVIIAADTIISFNDYIFGKPHNEDDAERMLNMLNGRQHNVITGFTINDTGEGRSVSRSVVTMVFFNRMTMNDIKAYVKTGEPVDKAGAYAIQGLGAAMVKKIEGDYNNVVGLPVDALMTELRKFGVYSKWQ